MKLRWYLLAGLLLPLCFQIVNSASTSCDANKFLNSTSPPPSGCSAISVNAIAAFIGDSGSGGTKGLVPAPSAGDAAANKVLGAGGGFVTQLSQGIVPQGRLTLTTATPILTATVSGATTIYYTPYVGQLVPVYDGTSLVALSCPEVTNLTTASSSGSAGPAAVTTSSVYDLYIWNNAGVCTLTRSPAWASGTTRGTGAGTAEQERVKGLLFNKQAITNGPAADRGTYVGTVASNASSTIDYIFGAAASGGTAGRLAVWNYYNRVRAVSTVADSGTSYTYSSATIRQARGSAAMQTAVLFGAVEGSLTYTLSQTNTFAAVSSMFYKIGVGLGTITAFTQNPILQQVAAANAISLTSALAGILTPTLGMNTISANEAGDGTNNTTFNSVGANTLVVSGSN